MSLIWCTAHCHRFQGELDHSHVTYYFLVWAYLDSMLGGCRAGVPEAGHTCRSESKTSTQGAALASCWQARGLTLN